ncbi:acetate--CoA ligase family protein [Pseudonocardia xishanensis]|uniref:Acetate--CoA ligase n=1 Tax=Pseudonocardia xishanensis TaxID=630995 RepID=A0ABP8RTN7_9PSEU
MTAVAPPTDASRPRLYAPADLEPLLRPASVAVVGASQTAENFGTLALRTLTAAGVRAHAVHPRAAGTLHGVPVVPRLVDVPGGVDCVLVAVPAAAVEGVVEDAVAAGCRGMIIFSAGFGESGVDGLAAQQRILATARLGGLRIGGPNTAGVLNYRDRVPLTFVSDLALDLPVGRIGIVSQSGGIATHLGHVRHRGIGMSYTITTGNSVDVTALDYTRFLLDDDGTDVVALALEGVADAAAFAELGAASLAAGKPVVVLKTGRTAAGGRAAVSHTGSLAGDHRVFLAAAEQAGLQVVTTIEDLIETVTMYAKWAGRVRRPGGVGVVTTMGGHGVLTADAAAENGVELPAPRPATLERLGALLPAFAAVGNPIDTTAAPPDPVLTDVVTAVGEDPGYAATVVLTATMTGPSTAGRPAAVAAAADRLDTPLAAVWLSSWAEGPGTEVLDAAPTLPLFRSATRCMRAVAAWQRWNRRLDERGAAPAEAAGELSAAAAARLQELVAAEPAGRTTLDEVRSQAFLQAAGLAVPRARVVCSAEEAVAAAAEIGHPVVAKIVSDDVPHKAAVGGVAVGLADGAAVAAAYRRIVASVSAARPEARLAGVLVAEAVPAGTELMVGLVRDPVFGPVVVAGAGGGAVELIDDVTHVVGRPGPARLRAAVERLRTVRRAADRDPIAAERLVTVLVEVVDRIGALAAAVPELCELDVNPLVVGPDGRAVALDGLAVLDREAQP